MFCILSTFVILIGAVVGEQVLTPLRMSDGRPPDQHGITSGPLVLVNTRKIIIPNFSFDGLAPATHWFVGDGNPPERYPKKYPGYKIPDEKGSCKALRPVANKDVTLTLPSTKSFDNVGWFGIYCDEFNVVFGTVTIPKELKGLKRMKKGLPAACAQCTEYSDVIDLLFHVAGPYQIPKCTKDDIQA